MAKIEDLYGGSGSNYNKVDTNTTAIDTVDTKVDELISSLVGTRTMFPPIEDDTSGTVHSNWIPEEGGLYNKSTYPALWSWIKSNPQRIVTESVWASLKASGNGSVLVYAGDINSDTGEFRMPDTRGSFFRSYDNTVSGIDSRRGYEPNIPTTVIAASGSETSVVDISGDIYPSTSYVKTYVFSGNVGTFEYTPPPVWEAQISSNASNITLAQEELSTLPRANMFINSDFSVHQRDTSTINSSDIYFADRWKAIVPSGSTATASYADAQFGDYRTVTHGALSTPIYFQQDIEADKSLQGKTITVSLDVDFPVASTSISMFWAEVGSTTALSGVNSSSFTPNTGRDTYSVQVQVPSISSWTSGVIYKLVVRISPTILTSSTYEFYGAKCEDAESASVIVHDEPSVNLRKCQRYYEKGAVYFDSYTTANATVATTVQYKVTKHHAANVSVVDIGSLYTTATWAVSSNSDITVNESFRILTYKNSGSGGYAAKANWFADSEI